MHVKNSAKLTLWINRTIALALAVMVFLLPALLEHYTDLWSFTQAERTGIAVAYYICLLLIMPALWNIDKLLRNILARNVFIRDNVTRIRRICWYCAGVGVVCISAAHLFFPLYFLAVIMFFLALVVNVIKDVMAAAVSIREENDLTI